NKRSNFCCPRTCCIELQLDCNSGTGLLTTIGLRFAKRRKNYWQRFFIQSRMTRWLSAHQAHGTVIQIERLTQTSALGFGGAAAAKSALSQPSNKKTISDHVP